jgi:hypothetical protein
MRDGAIYRHPMDTPAGKIRTWAIVSVEGSTVTLNDVSIYPEKPGDPALALGLRELVRLRDEVAANAALAGYETLRIKALRTDRFQAADRHPLVDVNVDLAPYRRR